MLKKLSPSPTERLRDRFRDHPLLQTCQQAFHHYMASMEQFDFTAEDLFAEAAEVLDGIFEDPTNARQYVTELWDSLKIKLKQKAPPTPPQADLDTVCGVLHYVVAATLSLHWHSFYNTELVALLRDIVERKGRFANAEEQKEIITNLCRHAEGLDEWVNKYEDNGGWLSEEIGKTTALPIEEEPLKLKENTRRKGRPKETLKEKMIDDADGSKLDKMHKLMKGKKGRDAALAITAALKKGWMTKPTHTQVEKEFGDVGKQQGFTKYLNETCFTDEEMKGVMRNFS